LSAALEAAQRDIEENQPAICQVEEVRSIVRELFRTLRRLESVRHSETEYVAIGPTLAHEVEPKLQSVLGYFAGTQISPSHLRKCVTQKILATEGLLDALHAGIRSEVAILGHLPGAPVPVDPIRTPASRAHLAKVLADYITLPRPERLAGIKDPDPTPDGSRLPGLAILLAWGEHSRTEEPPTIDQTLLFTVYKISSIAERLLGFKSSVITGSLRVTSLRWTLMGRAFVEDQPQELDVVRLITALLDLARDARWRVMYERQAPSDCGQRRGPHSGQVRLSAS
jgi:hypothetical protein